MSKPNLEVVRRICRIHGCERCWMLNNANAVTLLHDAPRESVDALAQELRDWTGTNFILRQLSANDTTPDKSDHDGQPGGWLKILPIQEGDAFNAIRSRRDMLDR